MKRAGCRPPQVPANAAHADGAVHGADGIHKAGSTLIHCQCWRGEGAVLYRWHMAGFGAGAGRDTATDGERNKGGFWRCVGPEGVGRPRHHGTAPPQLSLADKASMPGLGFVRVHNFTH